MPQYRYYLFGRDGQAALTEERDCREVADAIAWASEVFSERRDVAVLEVWQRYTLVHRQERGAEDR